MVAAAAAGFNLGSAIVLGLVIMGLVSMVHTLVYGPNSDRVKVGACLGVSFLAVVLVAASDFAHQQIILDRPLDSMNFWSQMVIVFLAAGIASGVWQVGPKAISNIGIPMPKYPTHKAKTAAATGAPLAGTGLTGAAAARPVAPVAPPTSSPLSGFVPFPDAADNGYPGGVAPTDADVAALADAPTPTE